MSRPIKPTKELMEAVQEEFANMLKNMKMFDGKVSYNKNFVWDKEAKATIEFAPVAFAKMVMLLQNFESEVAWHGLAVRDEHNESNFIIEDILVYPQEVTGSTVNTDQNEYSTWMYTLDDETFNKVRMQGHSHVRMGTTPSATDLTHQEQILEQLDDDMFYIFMIWNKSFSHTIKIYDMKNNTLYEDADITVFIGNEGVDLDAFLKGAKEIVRPKTYTPKVYIPKTTGWNTPIVGGGKKETPKQKPKNTGKGLNNAYDDNDMDMQDWYDQYQMGY